MELPTRTKRQSPQPIRIVPHYVTATISDELLNMLQAPNGPIEYSLNYFQRTLSVIPIDQNLFAPENATSCGPHAVIPDDHKELSGTGVPNADYLYYITAVNDGILLYCSYVSICKIAYVYTGRIGQETI